MYDMTGVILAGGKSSRMGEDKALLRIGQLTMIERIATELKKVVPAIVVVSNHPESLQKHLGLPVVRDLLPGCGPLGGIHAGLTHAATSYVFVTACDMPFIDSSLIPVLAGSCSGYDAAVPRIGQCLEPLFAVYGKSCFPAAEKALHGGYYKLTDFLASLQVNYVNEALLKGPSDLTRVFMNINTPKDLYRANKLEKLSV